MSMVELSVALGLVGIAALGVATIISGMGGSSKEAEAMTAKTELASSLGVYLYSRVGCEDLKGETYSGSDASIELSKWNYEGITSYKDNTKMKHFEMEKLKAHLVLTPDLPVVTMTYADGSTKDLKKTLLKVTASLKMRGRDYAHAFNVPVLVNSENQVEFCGDEKTIAETCTSLRGTFDPATGLCVLKETCMAYGSYTVLSCYPEFTGVACDNSRGVSQVNPLTGTLGCPGGSTATATGADNWNIQRDCGKKCTADINHTIGYFSCLKCP